MTNHKSHGNNHSNGNNWSYGNNWSNGNNHSNGNNRSDGNNHSNGNNRSDGNNRSNGNNWSYGNNFSDGNNFSFFLHNCRGTHKSILCHDKEGIAYMVLNQQADKERFKEFRRALFGILDGFLPYTTTYRERKADGWHEKANQFVTERVTSDTPPYLHQYHEAWSHLAPEKAEKIRQLIRDTQWLDTDAALETFEHITGLTGCSHANGYKYCPNCGCKLEK